MAIFYAPQIEETLLLPEEESIHCTKVLRMKENEDISIINGKGTLYKARILKAHPKHTEVSILEKKTFPAKNYRIHIAIAPTKNIDRIEWFAEKATEIGIDEITPILCHHSERKAIHTERLEKIAISASKQSQNAFVPKVNPMTPFQKFMDETKEDERFIAHCYNDAKTEWLHVCPKAKAIVILIGPEGDFSEEEVANALKNGFLPVSLGNSRLRTETAGVVACHIANLAQQL